MRANSGAAMLGGALLASVMLTGASLMSATTAQAQSVWGGPGSTTTTQAYKLGTNWDPNGAPVAAGQSAIFDTTGKPTINVAGGAIAPDSWTFNANSQSYTIGGAAAVNFSATGGLFNNANAGQTISIANNLGESAAGAQLQQLGNSTLILTGNNTYSGGTVIAAGTLQIGNGGTTGKINGDVLDLGVLAFNRSNNVTFGGLIFGSGQVNQIGTGTLILTGTNSYSGGTLVSNFGTLRVNNSTPGLSSSVGTGTVTLDNGQFQAGAANLTFSNNFAINNTLAGSAIDANGRKLTISGNIGDGNGPGALTVVDSTMSGGVLVLTGANTYTGGTTICACGTLQLGTAASSGSIIDKVTNEGTFNIVNADTSGISKVINQSGAFTTFRNSTDAGTMTINNLSGGSLEFHQTSSAADAVINNHISASTTFFNSSTAGNATINNKGFGVVEFNNNSTAGDATIDNAGHSSVVFNDQTKLEGGQIVNKNAGLVFFYSQSSAGNVAASITNNNHGQVHFLDQSTAGSATITNNDSGVLDFNNHSSADNATIVNNSAIGMAFLNHSTAGNAFITTNNGSATYFFDHGDGGTARFETASGGIVDFSGSNGLNNDGRINAGSIAGAGNYYIGGGNTLVVGGNDRSTEVSGVIADFSCGCSPGSGALQKVGLGTMILSGANTYTGGTTITAGTLQLGNGGASGSILGDVVNNSVFAINRSDAFAFNGVISGSGEFQQIGAGTTTLTALESYTGLTTITAGTLALTGAGNIASSSGVVANGAFDISGVSGAGTSIQTLSGYGSVALGIKTLTLTNASGNFAGAIGGSGGVTLAAGTQTLSGINGYTGATTINGGTLALAGAGSIASSSGVVDNGIFDISGTPAGASIKSLSGSGGVALGAKTLTLTNASGNFAGVIGGSGGVTLLSGSETLSGTNTYTGATMISGGTLIISVTGSITSDVTNNATFNNAGTVTGSLTNSGTASNSGTITNGLTNTAGTTTNTGTIKGGATVAAGTLNTNTATSVVNGGLTNAATVNAAGVVNGAIANNAGTFTVTGTLTSDNTFTNAAAATLAVGAAGAYTLQGMLSNSGVVTVAGGGQLIATVGGITNNAGGTITVAVGGTVKDDLNNASAVTNNGAYVANVATNTGTGSITNTATGTWTGNILGNAAVITNNGVWAGNVASNIGIIDNNKTWTGSVANAGMFNNNAGATVSGLLTNSAGVTTNNGSLNGGALVSGGALTGTGTAGNTTIANGGTFIPGNGTPGSFMTVAGNLAFQSGALYLVGLNPATSTFANVTGTAALNGGAGAAFLAGSYVAKQYTILTAAGGVSGTFSSFDTLGVPASFTASLSYDAHDVFLNLDLVLAKYAGLNVNQQNAANAIVGFFNTNAGIPLVFGGLTPAGLTQISGELATGSQQTTFDVMKLFMSLLTDPFVAGRGDGVAPATGASQFAEESDAANAYAANGKTRSNTEREAYAAVYRKASIRDNYDPRWSVWAAGYGGSQTTDGNAALGSNNTRSSIGGVAVGADYRFSPYTIAGFAIAGGGTNFSVNGLGSGRSDLFQAGAFIRHNVGAAYITGALAYGWQDITTDRTVTVAGTDLLHANFNANAWSGRVEGGYRFVAPWMGGVGITPYAAGQFTTFDLPAYAEQALAGANTFALSYAAKSATDTRSELGLRSDKSFAMTNGIFTLRGRAAWAHDFNPDRNIGATFQTLPGASFVVNGAAQASDAALVTGSAEMKWLNGFALAATFEGEFSGVTRSYAGKGVARYTW